jgi:hypothetical protein
MVEMKRGSRGFSPWDASPSGGVRGSHSYSKAIRSLQSKKKSDEFLHPDRIKNYAFFLSCFFKLTALRKTLTCIEAYTGLIQARDAGKNSRNPLFFPLRNNQSGTDNEYRNIREKKELML